MQEPCLNDEEIVREFLVESHENLARLDQDLVALENTPKDSALLSSVFRTIHTIKGACGFLALSTLEGITHGAETLLDQLRDGKRELNPELVSLILETVDATRQVLASIETTGREGEAEFSELIGRLKSASRLNPVVQDDSTVDLSASGDAPQSAPEQPTEAIGTQSEGRKSPAGTDAPAGGASPRKQAAASAEEEPSRTSAAADSNIRVGVGLLDKLMDLVGELVLTRNQILQFNTEREDPALNSSAQRLNLITSELQEGVMKTRMQPIRVVWHNLPRVVRDLSVQLGKHIQVTMHGAETELDRTIIEAIKDPLIHLVRNSCDHGIEAPEVRLAAGKPAHGTMTLRAYHEGGQVNIEVSDDGAGINVERVREKAVEKGLLRPEQADKLSDREVLHLIFQPGFSTVKSVTNLSGRGVGMDVVKSHIERIGGIVDITSRPGESTTVKIRIPLTLAIIPGLVVTSGGEQFVIPQVNMLELIRLGDDTLGKRIEYVHGTPVYRRRGSLLPVAYLNEVLGLQTAGHTEAVSMVVLQAEHQQFGLVVDGINDTQEIVVKPLGKQLKGLTLYAGATIMGDGRVALILDVFGVGQRSGVFGVSREHTHAAETASTKGSEDQQRLLLFQAESFERLAVPLSLVARLEEFPQSAIEHASGGPVVQYRGRILPLVSLQHLLEPEAAVRVRTEDPVQVVVFNDGERFVGMMVDKIIDIAEEAVTARQKSGRKGILGSAVVGNRVTDFLDVNEVIYAARENWFRAADGSSGKKTILVADASAFWRGLIKSGLEMAGHLVLEASNVQDALQCWGRTPVDLIAVALDLPPGGGAELVSLLHSRPDWRRVPMLAIAESVEQARTVDFRAAGFHDCQAKFDTAADLESIARLISTEISGEAELAHLEMKG